MCQLSLTRNRGAGPTLWAIGPVLALAWASSSDAKPTQRSDCLPELRQALIDGQFSGPVLCVSPDVTLRRVGRTSSSPRGTPGLTIYDYRYKHLPHEGGVKHGGQRLLLFDSKRQYVGQYILSPPPYNDIVVRARTVRISARGRLVGQLQVIDGRPPETTYVAGEVLSLSR